MQEFCIEGRSEIDYKAHGVEWKSCTIRILCRIFDTGGKNQIDYKAHGVKWKNCAFTYFFFNIRGHECCIDLIIFIFSDAGRIK